MRRIINITLIPLCFVFVACHQESQKQQPIESRKNEQLSKPKAKTPKSDLTHLKSDLLQTLSQEPTESLEYQPLQKSSLTGESMHDFGAVVAGTEVRHEFKLRNIGQESLIVADIVSGCRCTTGLASDEEIQPNADLQILVKFLTPVKHGNDSQEIMVYLTGKESGSEYFPAKLTMKGKIIMPLEAIPNQVLFGKVPHGEERMREIALLQRAKEEVVLNQISSSSKYVKAKIVSAEADENIRIQVSLFPNAPIGDLKVDLGLKYEHRDKASNLKIPVSATVMGDLEVFPKHLFFGIVPRESGSKKTASLKILRNKKIHIKSVNAQSEYVRTTLTSTEQGEKHTIQTEILADAPVGELRDTITVFTDSPVQPQIEIPLYAQIR